MAPIVRFLRAFIGSADELVRGGAELAAVGKLPRLLIGSSDSEAVKDRPACSFIGSADEVARLGRA